jgi:Flp pilus assembly protein TadD
MSGRPWRSGILPALCCAALAACSSQQHHPGDLTADARLRIAQAAEAGGDSDLAAAMYGAAATTGGSNPALQLKVATGLARNGKIALAEEALRKGLRANPGQPDLLRALGLVHVAGGKPDQAIAELDQVLSVRPRDVPAMVDKAVALDMTHHHVEAQLLYRQALAVAPDDPDVHNDLALSLMLEGRLAEATAELVPLKDAETTSGRLRNNLGVIYAAAGNPDEAQRLLGDDISPEALQILTQAIPKSPAGSAAAR